MNLSTRMLVTIILFMLLPATLWSLPKDITINQKDSPERRLQKEATGEYLVHDIDNKALDALDRMIKKNRGQANEADLLMRKAELLIKRTRSAKFFEMQLTPENEKAMRFIPLEIKEQKSKRYLTQANTIYLDIIKRYPKFDLVDQALYRLSFNYEQLGESNLAFKSYHQLIMQYPKSSLIPDAHLAMGEILYHQNKFSEANQSYEKVKPFKSSRAYWYAEYKMAWSFYNLKQSETALEQITTVIQASLNQQDRLTLLQEAIKDSTLFYVEARDHQEAPAFYKKLLTQPKLYFPPLIQLGNIYIRYGKLQAYRDLSDQVIKFKDKSEHHGLVLTQRFNFELEQKNYAPAFEYAQSLLKFCADTPECKLQNQSNYNLLIKNIWKDHKKSNTKDLHILLEKVLQASYQIEPNPLLADFYFEQKKYSEAAKYYYQVFQIQKTEKLLLATIDSLLQEKDNKAALEYQKEFVKQFPLSAHTIRQSMQITLFYLTNKQPQQAKPYLDQITAAKEKIKGEDYNTLADLELDYLNQVGRYSELAKQAEVHANKTESKTQKEEYLKIKSQSQIKILVENIKNEKTISRKEDLIKQLRLQLADQDLRATKDQQVDLYLFGITQATEHKLFTESWLLSQAYFKVSNPNKNTLEIAKKQLHAALSEGYLDESLEFSLYIATHPLEKDKTSYIKNCLELLKITGKDKDFIKFADFHLQPQSDTHHSQLLQKLWADGSVFSTSEISLWAEEKINRYQLEPSYSLLQVKKLALLLDKKQYSDVFNQSKKWYQTQYSNEVRAEARWLQARVLEKELLEISSKIQRDRVDLVMGIKTERFEKAQKAYQETLNLAKSSPLKLNEAQAALDRINHHFISFTQSVAKNHQRSDLQELSKLLEKELLTPKTQVELPLSTTYVLNLESLSGASVLFPALDETFLEGFPEIEAVKLTFDQALGAYHKSLIAFKEKDYNKALFLNDIGLSFKKDHPQLLYQRGRILVAQKRYGEALALWKPLLGSGVPTPSESTLHFFVGYYEGNCYKSLGFIKDLPSQKSIKQLTAPFAANCLAKTKQLDQAYQLLEDSSLTKDWQKAHQGSIAEIFENNSIKAAAYYKSAHTLSQNPVLKTWLKAKLDWIKTQAEPLISDKRLSEEHNL